MELTKKQKAELKKQEDCIHEWEEEIIEDKTMLNGFYTEYQCKKCPTKRVSLKIEIEWILQHMAKEIKKPREKITTKDIMKLSKQFFNTQITKNQAETLLANPRKYL